MKKILCILFALAVLLLAAAAAETVEPDHFGDVVKVAHCNEYITLREEPSTSAKALDRIPLGKEALLLIPHVPFRGDDREFSYVLWQGQPGYVLSEYLDLAVPADISAPFALRWPGSEDEDAFDGIDEDRAIYAEAIEMCVAETNIDPENADFLIGSKMTVIAKDRWIPAYEYDESTVPTTAIASGATVTRLRRAQNGRVNVVMEERTSYGENPYRSVWVDEDCLTPNGIQRGVPVTDVTEDDLRAIYGFINLFPYMNYSGWDCESLYPLFDSETEEYAALFDSAFGKIFMDVFYHPVYEAFELQGQTDVGQTNYWMPAAITYQIALQYFDYPDDRYAISHSEIVDYTNFLTLYHGETPVEKSALYTRIDSIEELGENVYAMRFHIAGSEYHTHDDRRGLIVISTDGGFGNPRSFRLKYFIFD